MSRAVKITISDNNKYKIEYISQHFAQHEDLSDKTFNRNEILKIIEQGKYQFVLLDYSFNEDEGQKLLKDMRLKTIKTPIVVFSNPRSNHNIIITQNDWMIDKTGSSGSTGELMELLKKFIKDKDETSEET
ncbi:MAG: hypothetical protein N2490_07790 [Ignavibacteria bacterium]|nr:hypothetical protein [Ignavibacteria bacterium]